MKHFKNTLSLLTLGLAAFFMYNCGSPDDTVWTDDGTGNGTDYYSLWMEETDLKGGHIYTIYADAALPQMEYSATLGAEKINFVLEEGDSSLVFLMPFIETGSYELVIDSLEANSISITVVEAEKIDNPNALIEADIAEVDTLINQVNRAVKLGYSINESQIAELTNFSSELKTMVSELSNEDKEKLAIFLNANWVHLPDFEPLLIADSLVSNKRAATNPTAELERLSSWFVVSLTTTIATLPPLYKLITVAPANPWALVGAGALAVTCGTAFITSQVIAEQIGELRGIPDKLSDELRQKTAFQFSSEVKRAVWPKLNYRTIKREDANSSVGLIANLLGEMLKFETLWKRMKTAVETVEGWIGRKIISLDESPLNIDDEPDSKYFSPDYRLVEVVNVTNGVVMKKYVENGVLKLEAISDTETEFAFALVYSDDKYGFEFNETYAAKVLVEPCLYMTAPVIKNVSLVCDGIVTANIEFEADGDGALIYGGSGWCDPEELCYPTRLYFLNPGAPEYSIASNSYSVNLKSGNANLGVAQIRISSSGQGCTNGKSAAESLEDAFPGYKWKVQLMNTCNQRSSEVAL